MEKGEKKKKKQADLARKSGLKFVQFLSEMASRGNDGGCKLFKFITLVI